MHLSVTRSVLLVVASMALLPLLVSGQPSPRLSGWPAGTRADSIPSSLGPYMQPTLLRVVPGDTRRPLVVSLHSWSGTYEQEDPLAALAAEHGFHYVHPDFRGRNNRPAACGSRGALQDIDDAIAFMRRIAPVDTTAIHVVGSSGGGHATMMAYTHSKQPVRSFSAWVGISDIEAWFYQCLDAKRMKYAREIARVTRSERLGQGKWKLNVAEARRRSPLYRDIPVHDRRESKLYLYAGVHDGHTGSVPISHTLLFYNKVVAAFAPDQPSQLVPLAVIDTLLRQERYPWPGNERLGGRKIHWHRAYADKVEVTIFEGGHEMLPGVALQPLLDRRAASER